MKPEEIIRHLLQRWKLKVWLKIILLTVVVSLTIILLMEWLTITGILLTVLGVFAISLLSFKSAFPDIAHVIALLNRQFPELEYSTDLLINAETKGLAELQKNLTANRLTRHYKRVNLPVSYRPLLWTTVACLLLMAGKHFLPSVRMESETAGSTAPASEEVITATPTSDTVISELAVSIIPPAYSGLPARHQSVLDVQYALQGSILYCKAVFEQQPAAVWLRFSNGDSIPMDQQGQHYLGRNTLSDKGFYTLNYILSGDTISSAYAQLQVMMDKPPQVAIQGIPQYQRFHPAENAEVAFEITMTDDFGLADGFIVATITKGSGESVKFREQKIPLNAPVKGKSFHAQMRLSAAEFEMEPGNELYFYLEGSDNRQPAPQTSRTETFFFVLEDTSETVFSLEGDLGINLMPEYFRSQRQIIIDTERLLKERSDLSKQEFNQRSNELGFDQKTLRLKYGQFIGDESESGLDIQNEVEEDPKPQAPGQVDVLSEYGHDHDHENEEGQHMDKGTTPREDAVSSLSHSHDNAEQATFLEQSVKAKLKAALKEMWDAELYLRLYQPQNSLPYQNRALKLLTEIRNHARIYVHRIGFDPPPVNEEKSRRTGDISEVHEETFFTDRKDSVVFPHIRNALHVLNAIAPRELPVSNQWKSQLRSAGNEVAALAIEQPGAYLSLLSELKTFVEQDSIFHADQLIQLRAGLLRALPPTDRKPDGSYYPEHVLLEEFVNKMIEKHP